MPKPLPGRPFIMRDPDLRRLYWIWWAMLARCHDPRVKSYPAYGGKGIAVCVRWRAFWNFHDDMAPRPPGRSMLDRRDNDLGYSPDNCRWVNAQQSNSNRRWCIIVEGVTLKQYMRDKGIADQYRMVTKRIKKNMPVQEALLRPARTWPGAIYP